MCKTYIHIDVHTHVTAQMYIHICRCIDKFGINIMGITQPILTNVCICMYVFQYMHRYICRRTYTIRSIYISELIQVYIYPFPYTYTYTCIYIFFFIHIVLYVPLYIHTCISQKIFLVHSAKYIYIRTYTFYILMS